MEHLHRYRTHIYAFVIGLAVITIAASVYSYYYNPTNAQAYTPSSQAVDTDPSTWKGVNVLMYFTPSGLGDVLTQQNFDSVAATGANVVRLQFRADPIDTRNSGLFTSADGSMQGYEQSVGMLNLKKAVAMAAQDNLKVILSPLSMPGTSSGDIWTNQSDWTTDGDIWTAITDTFKNNPTVLAFDLMNEPNVLKSLDATTQTAMIKQMVQLKWTPPASWTGTPRDYNLQIGTLIGEVRAIDPRRTIIVQGFGDSGAPNNFAWQTPIQGYNNIVYSFHMYQPTAVTYNDGKSLTIVGIPGSTTLVRPFAIPTDITAVNNLLGLVVAFQQKYNVPIYVGEFGLEDGAIYGTNATGQSYNGSCWMSTVMNDFAAHDWGWSYFTFYWPTWFPSTEGDPRRIAIEDAARGSAVPDYCNTPPALAADPINTAMAPTISLNGSNPMVINLGSSFTDPGATATDPVYGDISDAIITTGVVNRNKLGSYTLNYQVYNAAGKLTKLSRIVTVVPAAVSSPSAISPVITLNGSSIMTITVGNGFIDPGATATDDTDGDLSSSIVTSGTVDTTTSGTYTLTYKVTDAAGNTSSATRIVIVVALPVSTGGATPTILSSPAASNITQTVSQPITTAPASNILQFHVESTIPTITTKPITSTVVKNPTTTTPKSNTIPVKTVTSSSPSIDQLRTTLAAIAPSTTIVSIDYTLDGKLIHTTNSFPDTWKFNTTTIPDGAYNLTVIYHYQDGSTQQSITIFTIKNGSSFIQSFTKTLKGIWQAFLAIF